MSQHCDIRLLSAFVFTVHGRKQQIYMYHLSKSHIPNKFSYSKYMFIFSGIIIGDGSRFFLKGGFWNF